MYKFILISFGFLGWTFYEMSGGAEFEPASVRLAAQADLSADVVAQGAATPAPLTDNSAQTEMASLAASTATGFVDTDPPLSDNAEVTRVALNLTSLQDVQRDAPANSDDTIIAGGSDDLGVPRNVGFSVSSDDTPAIIPSLIAPNDQGATTATTSLSAPAIADVRTVTGNRVNVRSGPGTSFGVVNKLVQGDTVEILEDNGDGWVKLRPSDDGPVGWMADFLLTAG